MIANQKPCFTDCVIVCSARHFHALHPVSFVANVVFDVWLNTLQLNGYRGFALSANATGEQATLMQW